MAWQTIPVDEALGIGHYRFTFGKLPSVILPDIQTPKTISAFGYSVTLDSYQKLIDSEIVEITVAENPTNAKVVPATLPNPYAPVARTAGGYVKEMKADIPAPNAVVPVAAVVIAILAVLGLGILYAVLTKTEKLVDNPSVSLFVGAVAVVALIGAFKFLKK